MTETVNSAVKRSLGFAVRARSWFREFREIALMCVVYNIKRFVKQRIPTPYSDSTQPSESTVGEWSGNPVSDPSVPARAGLWLFGITLVCTFAMHESDSTIDSSRLDDITNVGKRLIQELVREAVQDVFEQERWKISAESQTTTENTSQSGSRQRQVLGIAVGLIAMAFLLRRRTRL